MEHRTVQYRPPISPKKITDALGGYTEHLSPGLGLRNPETWGVSTRTVLGMKCNSRTVNLVPTCLQLLSLIFKPLKTE